MARYILPSNSAFAFSVDDDTFDIVSKYKWRVNHNGYLEVGNQTKLHKKYNTRRLHRIIYMIKNGFIFPYEEVDHMDRDPLNNQINNLRLVTRKNNSTNTRGRSGSTSIYKGVHFDKYRDKYIAKIKVDKKTIYLGAFDIDKDAARAYDDAARKYFGDYAYVNGV